MAAHNDTGSKGEAAARDYLLAQGYRVRHVNWRCGHLELDIVAERDGVLVVSGGEKSGTRITARHAYDLGRDVFAFPYAIGDPAGAGCNKLIKDYAKLTENSVDIASAFGINLTETEEISLTEAERAVYEVVRQGETHLMQISAKTGLKPYELSPVLTLLEMKNLVVSCGGNRYAAIR